MVRQMPREFSRIRLRGDFVTFDWIALLGHSPFKRGTGAASGTPAGCAACLRGLQR